MSHLPHDLTPKEPGWRGSPDGGPGIDLSCARRRPYPSRPGRPASSFVRLRRPLCALLRLLVPPRRAPVPLPSTLPMPQAPR